MLAIGPHAPNNIGLGKIHSTSARSLSPQGWLPAQNEAASPVSGLLTRFPCPWLPLCDRRMHVDARGQRRGSVGALPEREAVVACSPCTKALIMLKFGSESPERPG